MSQTTVSQSLSPGKGPSVMRYERVQLILEAEPALCDRLGPKDQDVLKKNGEPKRFSRGVIEVTNRIHAQGADAHTAPKPVVLAVATEVLRVLKSTSTKKAFNGVVQAADLPKPKNSETAKADEGNVQPTARVKKPRRQPKLSRAKETTAIAEVASPVAAVPVEAPAVPPEPATVSDATAAPVSYSFLSVLTLLLAAYNLLTTYDHEPGAEKRLEKLSESIDEMIKLKDVPVTVPINTLPPSLKHGASNSSAS